MNKTLFILICAVAPMAALAQGTMPSAQPAPAAAAAKAAPASTSNFLGKDTPFFDPSNEMISWDGKNWNINDNRIFQSRFEKYLNAPEESTPDDVEYNSILNQILDLLQPTKVNEISKKDPGKLNSDIAFGLLYKASEFNRDSKLCETIASSVYAVWLAKQENNRLDKANEELQRAQNANQWNLQLDSKENSGISNSGGRNAIRATSAAASAKENREIALAPYKKRIIELEARIKANELKKEAAEILARLQFQSLLLQLFSLRRFQHVTIASRFYRSVFADGNIKLEAGEDAKKAFSSVSSGPPTLDVLDTLANEAIRDVKEGVDTYLFLIDKNEMASASKRLAEAFVVGEHLPEIRTLPREKKRLALAFTQKSFELTSSIEVKDYENADRLIKEMKEMARDFDATKPIAAIETSRTLSRMHLAKAINAATRGDNTVLENELKQAAEIWPRNPELLEVSQKLFTNSNVQNQAIVDLDRLLQQKNYREIDRDKGRYLIAVAQSPEKTAQLTKILEEVALIKGIIMRADEVAKRNDFCGAWETIESIYNKYPYDNELNQMRSNMTIKASDFVNSLSKAKSFEEKEQFGSSLAWYLEARRIYPVSEFASAGIDRIVKRVFHEYDNPEN